ncbi:hypothetical protein ACH4Q7_22885 [Streptomyces roseolus]|uniref:hypothetical protein n=1 Tax=Streptomyces roseolus TaxID=67358 RepID=UPI003789BCA1
MSRYFVSPDGGSFQTRSGPLAPPEGWEEVTAEEYETRRTAAREAADARAAEFLANDGQVDEEHPPAGAPIAQLLTEPT